MSFDPTEHLAAAYAAVGTVIKRADGREFLGKLSAPDHDAFGGMARNTDYRLRHPTLTDPLVVGELLTIDSSVVVGGVQTSVSVGYRVRDESRAFGSGVQSDTPLTQL